jgi:branched-chain amino acid transport system permease protein
MQVQIAIQVIISGIMLGAIYSLLAMGLTLIFGVVQIVNFAHGEFLMIGMFITFWLWSLLSGLDPLFSLFVVTPSLFLFGVVVYRFFFARVINKSDEAKIFLTVGLSMVLQNLALLVFKADYRTLKTVYSDLFFRVGEVTIGFPKLLAFVSAVLIAAGLAYLLIKTDFGKAMRAAAQDPQVAQLMGINTDRIYMLAVGLASAITGAAGAMIMPYFYVFPMVGAHFTTTCFCVVIMGGLGNVKGAFWCGLILGLAESMGSYFISNDSGLMISFILLVLVLMFRPQGLLSKGRI